MTVLLIAALLSLAVWVYLVGFHGRFWMCDQRLPDPPDTQNHGPRVVAVIPARDEMATVGATVASLLGQDYPGGVPVVVVDDGSTDGTAAAARAAAAAWTDLTVVEGRPLEPGWTGKLWALSQGIETAVRQEPDVEFLLLTDADIRHDPASLSRLVDKAESEDLDLVSQMVSLRCQSFWERLLVPPFVFFFQKLYPFPWVNDPSRAEAAAAGGCVLVRRSALEAAGGIAAIRDRVIDDVALAALFKARGARIWLGLSDRVASLRAYRSLGDLWRMVARTAFVQLDYSPLLLAGTVLGMILLYVVPPAAFVAGDLATTIAGGGAWLVMSFTFGPTVRLYRLPPFWGLLLPVAALLFTLMTVDSARRHWAGRGAAWKGRAYSELGE